MSEATFIFPNKKLLSGVPEGLDAHYLVKKIQTENSSLVHITRDDKRALALKTAVKFFDPKITVLEFPAWDCLPYDRVSPNKEISCLRVSTLTKLIKNPTEARLIITASNALTQRVPPKEFIASNLIFLYRTLI